MSAPESTPPTEDQLLNEAAAWFARMRGPEAEASRDEFEAWLRRGALHRRAYNRASEIFAMGKVLGEEEGPSAPSKVEGGRARAKVLAALTALVALVTVTWLVLGSTIDPERGSDIIAEESGVPTQGVQHLSTRSEETRSIRLEDGTVIRLEGGTNIEVRFDRRERRLTLERGMARFQVAHEPRPLVVHAAGARITAVGTLFEVGILPDRRVTVRLIEGSVEVIPPAADGSASPRPEPRHMRPGETMNFNAGVLGNPSAAAAEPDGGSSQALAGPSAARDYDIVTLGELVASANRGARRPIRLAEPATGGLRVSGRFRIDDTRLLAERLALLFDLSLENPPSGEIVLRRR